MTNHGKKQTAILLALVVALLPAAPAAAQRRAATAPPPMFHPQTEGLSIVEADGFEIDSAAGHWHHLGAVARGGKLSAVSPWGERLELRYFTGADGLLAVINERVSIFTGFDDHGEPQEMIVDTGERVATIDLAAQAQRFAAGDTFLTPPDLEAYRVLIEALQQEHSPAFWRQLSSRSDVALPTGCYGEMLLCSAAVVGYIASVASLVGACGAAVVTGGAFTPGCLIAILGHSATGPTAAWACGEALDCIETQSSGAQGDEGCSSPGGQE